MGTRKRTNLVAWAMDYRQIVILVTCCMIAFGIWGLKEMNKNEFPDFTIRQGVVVAVYPGVPAADVEQQLTKPLEDYIFTYKDVKKEKTRSYSRDGMSIVQIELDDALEDKDAFWAKFKHGIAAYKSSLPQGVLAVVVNDDFGDSSALLITLESEEKTYRELGDYMTALKDSLRKVPSVGRMTVLGMQKEQITVRLDADRLAQYGISEQSVAMTLLGRDFVTTAGTVRTGRSNVPIYVSRSLNAVADVRQMIVFASPTGNIVRLGDVADVRKEYAPPTSYVTNNGRKCLVLSVEMKQGQNITQMGADVDAKMATMQRGLPADVTLFKITDQPQVVSVSVWNFLKELLIAIVAVIIVVLLLMPWRVALVASSTIPITIFISLGLFFAFGVELNTVTLAALIVTLGMIVDNSIVIIDSYVEMLAEGVDRRQAAVRSASHFFRSILSATLAISVTFFPFLITMSGTFRDFVKLFPWAVTLVLLVSLAVAELVVPFMQYLIIREPSSGSGGSVVLDAMQRAYDRVVAACFARPRLVLAVGVASVVGGALMITRLPQRLMPTAERNQFAVEITLPTGASLARTAALADSLERILRQDERVVSVASFKGMASPRFQAGYAPQFAGTNYAQFIVNTVSEQATVEVLEKYRPQYEEAFPDAYVKFKQLRYGTDENPVEVRLTGDDWAALRAVADTVTAMLRADRSLRLVRDNVCEPLVAAQVTLDPAASGRVGVANFAVETALAMRYNADGLSLGTVWEGDYDLAVRLKGTHADSATLTRLEQEPMAVYGGLGSVPLRQVATVEPRLYDGQIPHRNGLRCITVMAEVAQGLNATAVNAAVADRLAGLPLPDGVELTLGGEVESNQENMPSLIKALLIAIAIIFFILVAHYKRVSIAALLLVGLLLCLPGTALGVWLARVDFSLTCFLGVISLMGILVRNAIIMFDYAIELEHNEQLTPSQAIQLSARRRMRPIFLTSAAASMGVIPMILGGSGLWMPMGAVICFGTLITMLFILTILPVAYSIINS